ncbi:hypothetical protein Q3G72_013415 [Acer saccharum]|nr:hypothetical protein Q3G72_013415 [Acer saccharum]
MAKKVSKETSGKKKKGSSSKTPPKLPKCTLNKNFNDRMGWGTLVNTLNHYCRRVVEEFYAGMNHKEFLNGVPVMVRGKEVQLEEVHINSYFAIRIPDDPEILAEMHDSIIRDDLYFRPNVALANEIVIEPMNFWVTPRYPLKHSNLRTKLAKWKSD